MGQSGQDAYSQAQQYGTFDLNVDVTDSSSLATIPSQILSPYAAPPIPDVAPAVRPFPWLLIVIAIVLITVSSEGR
jgi:hypothetical protein